LRLEARTRVEVFIPVLEDEPAYQIIGQWVAEEFAFERGGSTVTTTFVGLYASPSPGQVVRDRVQIIFTDVLVESADPIDLNELIGVGLPKDRYRTNAVTRRRYLGYDFSN
jgi:hypothetical protein